MYGLLMKSPKQGSDTLVHAAVAKEMDKRVGWDLQKWPKGWRQLSFQIIMLNGLFCNYSIQIYSLDLYYNKLKEYAEWFYVKLYIKSSL